MGYHNDVVTQLEVCLSALTTINRQVYHVNQKLVTHTVAQPLLFVFLNSFSGLHRAFQLTAPIEFSHKLHTVEVAWEL